MLNHHSISHLIISLTFITGVCAFFLLGEHSGNQNKTIRWKHYYNFMVMFPEHFQLLGKWACIITYKI